jgi:hypothetical protein
MSAVILALVLCAAQGQAVGPLNRNVRTAGELMRAVREMGAAGGTVRLAPGEYVLTVPIVFRGRNHVNIIGSGWNTTLHRQGEGDAIVFEDSGFCVVRDLNLVGSERAGSGIVFRGTASSSNTVDFCRIARFPVSGVRLEGSREMPLSSNTISRCHFISNLGDQLYSRYNNDFYILQNQFGAHGGTPNTGARLVHSSAGTYSMNYHWGNRVAFAMESGSHFNRIVNNRFENSRREGVVLGGEAPYACMLTIFTNNTIHTNSEEASGRYPAVRAANVTDLVFANNQVFSWDAAKVLHMSSLVVGPGCRDWIIRQNTFRHNAGPALVCPPDAGHVVGDNIQETK